VFGIDLEGLVERPAGGQHAKRGVEHQQRLVDGVDDRLGERLASSMPGIGRDMAGRSDPEGAGTFADGDGWAPIASP
jgi:hypothetical protein